MLDTKNPRVHAELLPALAAVNAPTNKILAIGSVGNAGGDCARITVRGPRHGP